MLAALGRDRLEGVRLQQGRKVLEIPCDRLACGFGPIPNIQLGQALGCRIGEQAIAVDDWQAFADQLARTFELNPRLRQLAEPDTLVCRCEDVPFAELADRRDWTDAKLHSRCGMGACQGRVCGAAGQFLFGWAPPAPRPPLSPARIETLLCLERSED